MRNDFENKDFELSHNNLQNSQNKSLLRIYSIIVLAKLIYSSDIKESLTFFRPFEL